MDTYTVIVEGNVVMNTSGSVRFGGDELTTFGIAGGLG